MKVKRLIPALAMLLIAAMMLGTSTFAWFAMGKTVTATNVKVTAKSDNIFLQIKNASGESSNAAKTEAAAVAAAKVIPPVEYKAIAAADGTITWGETTSADPAQVNYTARASLPDIVGVESDYVWKDTFKIWVAPNANANVGTNLVLTSVTNDVTGTDDMANALRVLVVGPDCAMLWAPAGASENGAALAGAGSVTVIDYKSNSKTALAATVPQVEADAITVTVYVYFSGNDDVVYTENVSDLAQHTLSLTFNVA